MSRAKKAAKAFAENVSKTSSQKDPMTWNLNKGLENLALAVAELEDKISRIEHDVHVIKGSIR